MLPSTASTVRTGWSRLVALAAAVLGTTLIGVPAHAGSGPWVIGDGEYSVYVGGEVQRLERLQVVLPDGESDVVDVDQGLSTLGGKGIITVGAQGRFEAELTVPYVRVQANRVGGVCESLGGDACQTTQGIGIITARGKGTLLDELYGAPITWAVGTDVRFGHFTTEDRHRITNLGEGTFDIGALTSIGRGGVIGNTGAYYTGYVEGIAWYRAPNTRSYIGNEASNFREVSAPSAEVQGTARMLFGWRPWFSLGPDLLYYSRPGGLDWWELDLGDQDRLAALRFSSLRVGGTVIIRARDNISFSASALHTVHARNNPYTTLVTLGVSTNGRLDRDGR